MVAIFLILFIVCVVVYLYYIRANITLTTKKLARGAWTDGVVVVVGYWTRKS